MRQAARATGGRKGERRLSQFTRFVLVGGLNTAISYGVYSALLFIGWHYALANLAGLVVGVFVGFQTTARLVFLSANHRLFGRYVLAWASIYLASIGIIGALLLVTSNGYVAGALAVPPVAVLSYFIQRSFVFGRGKVGRPDRSPPHPAPSHQAERVS